MEAIYSKEDISKIKNNRVIFDENSSLDIKNSKIVFKGENNILKIRGNVKLKNTVIEFMNDNSIVYLNDNPYLEYKLSLRVFNNCIFYAGKNNYFNNTLAVSVDEMKNVIIGDDCLFSFGIWIRTGDPHLIYDADSHKRINDSQSVYIGDHVWLGQNSLVLKNSKLGSGSIIGANAVVAGKKVESNAVYCGNPVRKVKEGVFFLRKAVHDFDLDLQQKYEYCEEEEYIYQRDEHTVSVSEVDETLSKLSVDEKLAYLDSLSTSKNRFFV